MDDAGTLDATDAGELSLAMMEEGIDEGAIGISRSGVDYHSVRFVEDEELVILVEYFEGDVLREGNIWRGLRDDDRGDVVGFYGVSGFGGFLI